MAFPLSTVGFKALPARDREGGWRLEAVYPDGRIEQIIGFRTEREARDWIGSRQCLEWAETRGYV